MGLWQWLRGSRGSAGRSAALPPPTREPFPAAAPGWSQVGPLQRTTDAPELLSASASFERRLVTRRNPEFLRPLGHALGASAPSGVIRGLLQPAGVPLPTLGPSSAASERRSTVDVQTYSRPGLPRSLVVADAPAQPRPLPVAAPPAEPAETAGDRGPTTDPPVDETPMPPEEPAPPVDPVPATDEGVPPPPVREEVAEPPVDALLATGLPSQAEDTDQVVPTLGSEALPAAAPPDEEGGGPRPAHPLGLGAPLPAVPSSSTPPVQRSVDTAGMLRALTATDGVPGAATPRDARTRERPAAEPAPGVTATRAVPSTSSPPGPPPGPTAQRSTRPDGGSPPSSAAGAPPPRGPRSSGAPSGHGRTAGSDQPDPSAPAGGHAFVVEPIVWPPPPLVVVGAAEPQVPLASARGVGAVQRSAASGQQPGGSTPSATTEPGTRTFAPGPAGPSDLLGPVRLPSRPLPSRPSARHSAADRPAAATRTPPPSTPALQRQPAGTSLPSRSTDHPSAAASVAPEGFGIPAEQGPPVDLWTPTEAVVGRTWGWPRWDDVPGPAAPPGLAGPSAGARPPSPDLRRGAASVKTTPAVQRVASSRPPTWSSGVVPPMAQAVTRPAPGHLAGLPRVAPHPAASGRVASRFGPDQVAPSVPVSRSSTTASAATVAVPSRRLATADPSPPTSPAVVDAGQVAVDLGLATRQPDGSVVFAPASPPATHVDVVQRTPDTQAPSGEAASTGPQAQAEDTQAEPAATTTATGTQPGPAGAGDLDELAARLYPRLSRQLRLELVRERDRLGSVVDVWH